MTAFLKIDHCTDCLRNICWEWVVPVAVSGRALPGTGVWRSQLLDGRCPDCVAALERRRREQQQAQVMKARLIHLFGGEKPYREFTFERYRVTDGNRLAYERARDFDPGRNNLYLWGSCGVGKTHLGFAIARRYFFQHDSVALLTPPKLSRQLRMKEPVQEQETLENLIRTEVFLLDDLGMGNETLFAKQAIQEILDGRDFRDRRGLVITSKYSLDDLARKLSDDTIPSRIAGMCEIVKIWDRDHRLEGKDE